MSTSQFMDIKVMDLSSTPQSSDFIDLGLLNPQEEKIDCDGHGGGSKGEKILPSYDFQPLHPAGARQSSIIDANGDGGSRAWKSADYNTDSSEVKDYSSLDSSGTKKAIPQKDQRVVDAGLITEIDRAMKKHADNLLHALEGVSARLSQLESRTRHLENSIDDLNTSIGNNQGCTDGKMRQLENILTEVQTGVENIRDKQEIMEAQLQVAQLQVTKPEQKPEAPNRVHVDPVEQPPSLPQSTQQVPPEPNQFPPNMIRPVAQPDPYCLHLAQSQSQSQSHGAPNQAYGQQLPPPHLPYQSTSQQSQPPQLPLMRPSFAAINSSQPQPVLMHPEPQQPYPQASQHSFAAVNSSQPQPAPGHPEPQQPYPQHSLAAVNSSQPQPVLGHPDPPQPYPQGSLHPQAYPPTGVLPQQYYGPPPPAYEPPPSRAGPGYASVYGPLNEPYSFGGPPSQPVTAQSGGGGYSKLPTARVLPQALPTTGEVGGSKVAIDHVIEKVMGMGFSRDQVRAAVRRVADDGGAVDLNAVLDRLMSDGEVQPQKGWRGR